MYVDWVLFHVVRLTPLLFLWSLPIKLHELIRMAARVALLAGPANSCFLFWVTAFVEDCCNGSHDPHSGHFIRSSLLAAANKKNPDKKRSDAYDGRDLGKAGFKLLQGSGHI